jgi:hypothetical protein
MTNLDRSEINRALAKAIAYKQCGKDAKAEAWAAELVTLLGCAGILNNPFTAASIHLVEG